MRLVVFLLWVATVVMPVCAEMKLYLRPEEIDDILMDAESDVDEPFDMEMRIDTKEPGNLKKCARVGEPVTLDYIIHAVSIYGELMTRTKMKHFKNFKRLLDSTVERGNPMTVLAGIGQFPLKGVDDNLPGMCVGQQIDFLVPPHLAFNGPYFEGKKYPKENPIPPGSIVYVQVKLLSIDKLVVETTPKLWPTLVETHKNIAIMFYKGGSKKSMKATSEFGEVATGFINHRTSHLTATNCKPIKINKNSTRSTEDYKKGGKKKNFIFNSLCDGHLYIHNVKKRTFPRIVYVVNGEPVAELQGKVSKFTIRSFIEKQEELLPSCSSDTKELCNNDELEMIEDFEEMGPEKVAELIEQYESQIKNATETYETLRAKHSKAADELNKNYYDKMGVLLSTSELYKKWRSRKNWKEKDAKRRAEAEQEKAGPSVEL